MLFYICLKYIVLKSLQVGVCTNPSDWFQLKPKAPLGFSNRIDLYFIGERINTNIFYIHSKQEHQFKLLNCRQFSKHRPSGLILSISRNVHISVCVSVCLSVHF